MSNALRINLVGDRKRDVLSFVPGKGRVIESNLEENLDDLMVGSGPTRHITVTLPVTTLTEVAFEVDETLAYIRIPMYAPTFLLTVNGVGMNVPDVGGTLPMILPRPTTGKLTFVAARALEHMDIYFV